MGAPAVCISHPTAIGRRHGGSQVHPHQSHNLNSLKGDYIGEYIGDYYRGY